MSGVAGVQARIAEISSRFPAPVALARPRALAGAPTAGGAASAAPAFGEVLASARVERQMTAVGGGVTGERVVDAAKAYLGVPYLWGGTDPDTGLDCSGLVQQAYADLGVDVPRVSRDQARAGQPVASLAEARPGDLVAFGSPVDHIGIYAGDGKMVVAPKRGDVVKLQDVYRTPTAIRRILPEDGSAPVAAAAPLGAAGESRFAGLFAASGAQHGVSPALLAAVARAESGFDPGARSPAGAQGLMQLMPGTARELGVDPWDPAAAVDGAARLLKSHLGEFGSTGLALAAYNAGPGAVRRHGGVPPYAETQSYVRKITAELEGRR